MPITEDVKDFLSLFDTKKDGIIDEKEIITLNKVLNNHAGKDKVLDKNELLQIFGLTPQSKNADKIFEQFQTVVQRASKYSSQTTKTQNGQTITTCFNADGSGTKIVTGKDKKGKITSTVTKKLEYNENNECESEHIEQKNASGKTVLLQTNNYNNGKLSTQTTQTLDQTGKNTVQ